MTRTLERRHRASTGTLDRAFDPRHNSLNALRLAFALFVLIGHGFHLGADRVAPHIGSYAIHDIGVDGFFVISGFLITNSRLRPGAGTRSYLRDRALRIFPAYWVCLIACAAVAAPLLLWRAGVPVSRMFTWDDGSVRFAVSNSLLVQLQHGIAGMPARSPVPGFMDSSLWTLLYEFLAYLVVAAAMYRDWLARRPAVVLLAWAACWAVLLWCTLSLSSAVAITHSAEIVPRGSRLGLMFASGAALRLYWHRVPVGPWWAAGCLAVGLAAAPLDQPRLVSAPLFAYVVIYLGTRRGLQAVGRRVDLSYGVYLYAWPLQQCLLAFHLERFGLTIFLLLSAAGAMTFGLLSYRLVEKPALALKSRAAVRARADAGTRPASEFTLEEAT